MKDFVLFVKYPYTAGIIGMLWMSAAAFLLIDNKLDVVFIVGVTMLASIIIGTIGFSGGKEV